MAVTLCTLLITSTVHAQTPGVAARVDERGQLQVITSPGQTAAGFQAFDPLGKPVARRRTASLPTRTAVRDNGADTTASTRQLSWQHLVSSVAREVRIDARLLHAVIQTESGYDPLAVSAAGARGLMQLMPATANAMGVRDPHDPLQNVRGGAALLKSLLHTYHGNVRLALAAYNAGEPAVNRHGGRVPDYPETKAYVRTVMARYARAP